MPLGQVADKQLVYGLVVDRLLHFYNYNGTRFVVVPFYRFD